MNSTTYIAYIVGLLSMLVLILVLTFLPLYCFKHRVYKNCRKCTAMGCPNSQFWQDIDSPPRGLFRFSPVFIFGAIILLAALILAILWFVIICLIYAA